MLRRRLKKNVLWTGFAIALLVTLWVSMTPLSMQAPVEPATLSPDVGLSGVSFVDPAYSPGSIFFVDFYIDDVEAMWGFEFLVEYNSTVLNATDAYGWYPFDVAQGPGTVINNTAGYVVVSYSYPMAEPNGTTTTTPTLIASIDFKVVGWGWSLLHVHGPPPNNISRIINVYGDPISHDVIDGFFSNVVEFPQDVAITGVDVSPTRDVIPGTPVSINVSVANQAPFNETFTVTAYANTTVVDSETVSLDQLRRNVTQLEWDTTGFALGNYDIHVNASVAANETDTDDNTLTFDDIVILGVHDIAVTEVAPSPRYATTGDLISINVVVENLGDFTESFSVTAKYGYLEPWSPDVAGEYVIGTKAVTSLAGGTSEIQPFTLDTSQVEFNPLLNSVSLWIESNASVVTYEVAIANNKLKMDGDVTVWTEPARLEAPVVVDPSFAPGQTFSMNITVSNVEDMYAYDFFLHYNTTVLNATNLTSYSDFTVQVQSTINNTGGWIHMNYNWSTKVGFSTVDPTPIARVDFNVTDLGDSPLDLQDSKISDVKGRPVPLIEGDGNFRNLLPPHDISVSLETPIQIYFGDSSLLNVTVYNYGVGNETDVEIRLLVNGTLEDSTFISELLSLDSYPWSYQWTPATTGVYNIMAYAPPVAGEQYTDNNNASRTVKVVIAKPTARFTVSPDNPLEGGIVTFDASTSSAVETTIASFKWDFGDGNVTTPLTFPIIRHTYAQNGAYTVTLNVTDERGASHVLEKTVTVYSRDVAVVSVVPSSTEVNVGDSVSINVTVTNQGDFGAETFNVITYYDDTTIDTLTVTDLPLGASETLTFTWDTTGVAAGTYTVKAEASAVPGEADTADNLLTAEVTVGEEAEGNGGPGQDYTLYIVAAVVIVVVVAALVYVFKIRKP